MSERAEDELFGHQSNDEFGEQFLGLGPDPNMPVLITPCVFLPSDGAIDPDAAGCVHVAHANLADLVLPNFGEL